ncbi:hypothetical protein RUM44_012884 [Polyplax serrata]|uniref:Rab-like protein 6 n=1 Tax=Polyplax serrata TaxID=468196 RepID=A0ABR1BCK6_POLSC
MFSALKRLTGRGDAPESGTAHPSHQTMSANLQRKFAKGVQYNRDRNVGKTCLFHRLQGKKFVETYIPTEEIQVASIHWNYKATDDIVKVEVWDVVDKGKKKKTFDGLKLDNTQLEVAKDVALDAEFLDVYKNANGVIMVMDITKSWTFNYIQRELPKIPPHIPIMILANHCDMAHHRTVTPHHLSFYVENLERGNDAAQVRCCESSMRNGFGLKILHKFFNLPFLQLQRDTLLKQLETNSNETQLTINELDLYMESDEADYNKFLEKLVEKRRIVADSTKPAQLQTSQSVHHLNQPVPNSVNGTSRETEIKRSVSLNESCKIGPIGGGHPISLGLHKTAIGVGNPHSKVLGPHFNLYNVNSNSLGDSRNEKMSQVAEVNSVDKSQQSLSEPQPAKDAGGLISKLFGKSKEAVTEIKDVKSNIKVEPNNITTVDEFIPDDGAIDGSFLEDAGQDAVFNNIEQESESDEELGNPLVSEYQDDLDPDDFATNKMPCNDTIPNNSVRSNTNIAYRNNNNESQNGSLRNNKVSEISAKLSTVSMAARASLADPQNEEMLDSSVMEHDSENQINITQTYDVSGEDLDMWFNCDSKQRRSPEGGEDNQNDNRKTGDDIDSLDSMTFNNSLLNSAIEKKEKVKKKVKEVDGKPKKSKKKSSDKDKEKSKTTDRKKKKASKTDDDRQNERDELEEFLNGPVASGVDSSYEAF